MKRIDEQASELPGARHVCIGDRESDILVLLVMARKMDHAADYLVRCQHNRVLPEGGKLEVTCFNRLGGECPGRRQASGLAPADQPGGTHAAGCSGAGQLVPRAVGN